MTDIIPYLEQICARFTQFDVQKSFHGCAKTIQFTFLDLGSIFFLNIAEDGHATLTEQTVAHPDITVAINSATLAGILDGNINPIQAYLTQRLKVKGNIEDLIQLQKLL